MKKQKRRWIEVLIKMGDLLIILFVIFLLVLFLLQAVPAAVIAVGLIGGFGIWIWRLVRRT